MFRNWGFLLGEIWVLLLLAALLGLFAGWLIWSRREVTSTGDLTSTLAARDKQIASLENDLANCLAEKAAMPVAPTHDMAPQAPLRLDAPRNGVADDLKRIKGIGPQMEEICNRLGFYHFDQIAAWTEAEIAWVDDNLTGFQGRVVRDDWVAQAKVLASGGETDFSKRVDKGDVKTSL